MSISQTFHQNKIKPNYSYGQFRGYFPSLGVTVFVVVVVFVSLVL